MAESVAEAICSFRNWALAIALRAQSSSQPLRIAEVCRKSLPGIVPPEDLPGSRLFEEFCGDTIKGWHLGDRVIKAKVTRIQPKSSRFRLWFEEGKSAIARRVIVVAGSGKPHLPGWTNQIQTQNPTERIRHSHQVDLRNLQLHGEQILIVGGGLTSGHLVVEAIVREAQVLLRTRRYLANYFFTWG
jgi:thioredoxin reductase